MSSILSKMRSAYSVGVCAGSGAISANVSPGFGCGRYAAIVTALCLPSVILCRSTRMRLSLQSKCIPCGKNIGVSQCESIVITLSCSLFASLNSAARSTSHLKSGSPSSPSHSGCHCTPRMLLCSLLSTASITPSSAHADVSILLPQLPTA